MNKKLRKLLRNPKLFFVDAVRKRFSPIAHNREKSANLALNSKPDMAVYNELVHFAANYPVNSLKYRDEALWPYIRHHLLVQLTAVSIGKRQARYLDPYRLQLGHPQSLSHGKRLEISKKYGVKFFDALETRTDLDFLFFTALNASEQVMLGEKIYYRVTDPLYEIAKSVGRAEKIELVKTNTPAIKKIPQYYHPANTVFTPEIFTSGYSNSVEIDVDFYRMAKRYMPSLVLEHESLKSLIDWELHTRDFYVQLLKKLNPKVVFFPAFHYYGPLISAARSLGIISVDIQHGIQVGYNPLYNDWSEMPPEGYAALPDYFFVWGEKERANIEKVFGGHRHRPVVIGNLWLRKQLREGGEIPESLASRIRSRRHAVLLAMQSQTEIPELFREIIKASPPDFLWVVRHHPKGKKYKPSDFGSSNVLIAPEVDHALLIPLLKHVDATLSEGSTVAVEGHSMGVPAFITSETGRENYRDEISQGDFYYVEDPKSFFDQFAAHQEERGANTPSLVEVDVAAVLRDLVRNGKALESEAL